MNKQEWVSKTSGMIENTWINWITIVLALSIAVIAILLPGQHSSVIMIAAGIAALESIICTLYILIPTIGLIIHHARNILN